MAEDSSGAAAPAKMTAPGRTALVYGLAVVIGVAAAMATVPWAAFIGTGGVFTFPKWDLTTNLIGHLAFQAPGWHWPLLNAPALAWPHGESIAMTDSNPVLSIVAKLIAGLLGHPVNLLGMWLALCLVLQAVMAVFLLRGFNGAGLAGGAVNFWVTIAMVALLALLLPEYAYRIIHINLMGQFTLLAALGLAVRHDAARSPPRFGETLGLLMLAIFIHPYLYLFCAVILAGPALGRLALRQADGRKTLIDLLLAMQIPAGLFILLNGEAGGGGPGYGLYSMNLLGPFWPQLSGLFGAGLPVLDATGYQQDGYNYLGAGVLLLFAAAVFCLVRIGRAARRSIWRRHPGLILVLLILLAVAVTPRLTAGSHVILPVPMALFERLFAILRASGRAAWAVDYALIAGSIALLSARLRWQKFLPLMAVILTLQWLDTAPLRAAARGYLAGAGTSAPQLALPAGTSLFRAAPLCGPEDVIADTYRLLALRQGAVLTDARLAHPPTEDVCARSLAQALSAPLAAGEARLFLPSIAGRADPAKLGAGVTCTPGPVGTLCTASGLR